MEADETLTSTEYKEAGAKNPRPSTKVNITCEQCDTIQEVYPSYAWRGRMKYCSRKCFNDSRRKNKSVEFEGDLFVRNIHGYYFSKRTRRMLHRVIWEKHHGPVPEGFRIYFRDKNRDNWAIDNLYLKELSPKGGCDECGMKIYALGKCRNHYEQMRIRKLKHTKTKKLLT